MAPRATAREELGRELRAALAASGLSRDEVQRRTGLPQPRLSQLLNLGLGRQRAVRRDAKPTARPRREFIPDPDTAATVAAALTSDVDVRARIMALARQAERERPGVVAREVALSNLGETQTQWGHLEADSKEVRTWMPALVPGLLQVEGYARSVFSSVEGKTPAEVEQGVKARVGRQRQAERLERCVQITTEGALTWGIPGPAVMVAQCESMIEVIRARPTWTVIVLPGYTTGPVPPLGLYPVNGFDAFDDRLVVIGTTGGNIQSVHRPLIDDHLAMFDQLVAFGEAAGAVGEGAVPILERVASRYRAQL